jgi:radical SAM superfamily enzyme YgiQ (UPF0313 family)
LSTSASPRRDVPRVLLIWPGGVFEGGGTFGVPQLLGMAQCLRKYAGAHVDVRDLDHERAFGPIDVAALAAGYDVVGLSCYSSFDVLKTTELARIIKRAHPRTKIVTGGYHPSARPAEFIRPGSPFDYVVVGDGEISMARLVESLAASRRPLNRVLGPEPLEAVGDVLPYDWSLLDRYKETARRFASQIEIYLSRGCPYDCSFCMERAKRETSWRPLDAEDAVEELHRIGRYFDLSSWTLRIVDPLFGMKREWRRRFLEALARRPLQVKKLWLLIRLDLVEREDFELFARCNAAPGFGLESGDPDQVRRIRKTGMLSGYLDKMLEVADWARQTKVPFGANIIAGHPGETESSLRTSAKYMERLFLDPRGSYGFLSVDPFRLYPGSPIDEERAAWEQSTGMRVHRYPWWHDGDQSFLSEWVDPSAELDYTRREALTHELFAPIVAGVRQNFRYQGPATDYFRLALDEQVNLFSPARRTQKLALHELWSRLLAKGSLGNSFGDSARQARATVVSGWGLDPLERGALEHTDRERFLPVEALPAAGRDEEVRLEGGGVVWPMSRYLRAFRLLALEPGDHYVEVGAAPGYGLALAERVVGPQGTARAGLPVLGEPSPLKVLFQNPLGRDSLPALPPGSLVAAPTRADGSGLRRVLGGTHAKANVTAARLFPLPFASDWTRAVFHVLAHVPAGTLPSSCHHPPYVKWAAERLGASSARLLAEDASVLSRCLGSHRDYARLQLLAWLFDSVSQAEACADRELAVLDRAEVARPDLLAALLPLGAVVEVLRGAVLLEARALDTIADPTLDRTELANELHARLSIAPTLGAHRVELVPALGPHGRVLGRTIYVGVPATTFGVDATRVAWQAAHEALVSAVRERHRSWDERDVERRAVRLLQERARRAGF